MSQDFGTYSIYHCIPKSLDGIKLFRDDRDKETYSSILAETCFDLRASLFAFDFLQTHAHLLLGLKSKLSDDVSPGFLEFRINYFLSLVNRRYGKYYRKKYGFNGRIFKKNEKLYKLVQDTNSFLHTLNYINRNACQAGRFSIYEDNYFTSYNYYLASFVHNPEIQTLPVIQHITSSAATLNVFKALDMRFAVMQYEGKRSFRTNTLAFLNSHRDSLLKRDTFYNNTRSTRRYQQLGLYDLYDNPKLIQTQQTQGHKVKRMVDELSLAEINRKTCIDYLHSFCSLFPWSSFDLKDSLAAIHKSFPEEFEELMHKLGQKVTDNHLSKLTGLSRITLKKFKGTRGAKSIQL
ncbi:MAG: hypothetical protein WCL54_01900 [Clostridia bacterium]